MAIVLTQKLIELMLELHKDDPFKYLTLPLENSDEDNDLLIAEFEKDNPDYMFASARCVQGRETVISYLKKSVTEEV